MNVPGILDPRKQEGRALYTGAIVLVVGLGAFGLGRLSLESGSQAGIAIVGTRVSAGALQAAKELAATTTPGQGGAIEGGVVASKTGSKYFFPWCGGASAIKDENKVWFASIEKARVAGYTAAGNCKGLE
jgi:hypothetical protein